MRYGSEVKVIRKDGHYELYVDGVFQCSADTVSEALKEYEEGDSHGGA